MKDVVGGGLVSNAHWKGFIKKCDRIITIVQFLI